MLIWLDTGPTGPGSGVLLMQIAFFVGIFAIFYFFIILPQKRQQKREQEFRNSLKKGDKVITTSGIHGEIVSVDGDTLLLEVDKNVKLRIDKAAIRAYAQSSESK
ncbi:MAG: preprotein translocase subunit YajC [Bacteroidia bacterium]|nr:preprotein translocase subunit YajC [Bacteroidia bacterium]MCX7651776.1 preprotein translocase subunit YajC [Bacteroidia bacterium]MDW8416352.1 preprotein translocase subunit YajC [Bacteroidia bacterium]